MLYASNPEAFNATLAKLVGGLKRDLGGPRGITGVRQNYKGTGAQSHRRQIWLKMPSHERGGPDLWLDSGFLQIGGIIGPRTKIPYVDHSPEEVYALLVGELDSHFAITAAAQDSLEERGVPRDSYMGAMGNMELSKPGKHGTLHLFELHYEDQFDQRNNGVQRVYAYDAEHAEEKFYDSEDSDGWVLKKISRAKDRHGRVGEFSGLQRNEPKPLVFSTEHDANSFLRSHEILGFAHNRGREWIIVVSDDRGMWAVTSPTEMTHLPDW